MPSCYIGVVAEDMLKVHGKYVLSEYTWVWFSASLLAFLPNRKNDLTKKPMHILVSLSTEAWWEISPPLCAGKCSPVSPFGDYQLSNSSATLGCWLSPRSWALNMTSPTGKLLLTFVFWWTQQRINTFIQHQTILCSYISDKVNAFYFFSVRIKEVVGKVIAKNKQTNNNKRKQQGIW